jgi:NitT/TauT family transport system permease protein
MTWHRLASLVVLLLAWHLAAAYADSRLLPGPAAVLDDIVAGIRSGALPYHLAVTLARVAVSFAIAMTLGSVLGLAMGMWPTVDRWLDGWVLILLNVPALVLIILAYVWLGLIETAAIVAVALNKIPNVAVTLREGARALDRDYSEVATVYRFGRWKTLHHVLLPQLAPFLFAAARNGLALIWKIVLVVELLGRSNGIGFQLQMFFQMFDVGSLLAYTVAFVVCVLTIEFALFQPLERRLAQWRR